MLETHLSPFKLLGKLDLLVRGCRSAKKKEQKKILLLPCMIKLPPFCIGIKKRILIDMREYCIFFCPRLTAIHSIFGHHADWTFKKANHHKFLYDFCFLSTYFVDFSIIYKKKKRTIGVCGNPFTSLSLSLSL